MIKPFPHRRYDRAVRKLAQCGWVNPSTTVYWKKGNCTVDLEYNMAVYHRGDATEVYLTTEEIKGFLVIMKWGFPIRAHNKSLMEEAKAKDMLAQSTTNLKACYERLKESGNEEK